MVLSHLTRYLNTVTIVTLLGRGRVALVTGSCSPAPSDGGKVEFNRQRERQTERYREIQRQSIWRWQPAGWSRAESFNTRMHWTHRLRTLRLYVEAAGFRAKRRGRW